MHKHKTDYTIERCFVRCVNPKRCNPSAHGGVVLTRHCLCGATKEINSNHGQTEKGPWIAA